MAGSRAPCMSSFRLLAVVVVLLVTAQLLSADRREEESACCGPKLIVDHRLGPQPRQCCGQGWGLHCCFGEACCFGDAVVRQGDRADRQLQGGSPWQWKHWAQWLNLGVVILVVAFVCAVLVCCWRRDKTSRKLLRLREENVFNYGTVGGHPSAPQWNAPEASRWVDFSIKPTMGTPLKVHNNPYYRLGPTVRETTSESDDDLQPSPVFTSSDEEYRLVAEFKRKTQVPG